MKMNPRPALLFGLFLILFSPSLLAGLDVPPLRGRVNDYARIIAANDATSLEHLLAQFEQGTGHQVAILTVSSLEGEDIESFGIRVADTWKIGQKGFDNGVILIVVPRDRKLRLEVGYGLEGVLPDAIASRILRDFIIPRFRTDDYSGGIVAGIHAVLKVIRQEPLPAAARASRRNETLFPPTVVFAILFALFGIIAVSSSMTRRSSGIWGTRGRRYYPPMGWGGGLGGGGFSGGGGGFGGGGASGSW